MTLRTIQRDPDATLAIGNADVTRTLSRDYATIFAACMQSGLTDLLMAEGALLPFMHAQNNGTTTLTSPKIPFISYPYEWCFAQYKAAALLSLHVQEQSLRHGFCLKDARADNVQWHGTKPCFIDHSSFVPLEPSQPWRAYRQFCSHFLVPLFLMSRQHPEAHIAMRGHPDGMPLAQARAAMRSRDFLSLGRIMHIYLHAGAAGSDKPNKSFSLNKHLALIDNLRSTIEALPTPRHNSAWQHYKTAMPYSAEAQQHKQQQVAEWRDKIRPQMLWDMGAHEGQYAHNPHGYCVAMDHDIAAIETAYHTLGAQQHCVPLWMDINNPSPDSGFAHAEHASLTARGKADGVLMLALIHHLRASGISFSAIAAYLARITTHALVEFVPPEDPQAKQLLAARGCAFDDYNYDAFMAAFSQYFQVARATNITDSSRLLVSVTCA